MLESRSLNTFYQLMKIQPKQLPLFIENLNLSGRQFHYDLEKINYLLMSKDLPPIQISNEHIQIPIEVIQLWKNNSASFVVGQFSFDQEERIIIFLLYTFIRREPLSSFHFQSILGVSKNTVSADVKRVNQFCSDFRVQIRYTREQGYHLKGSEEDKRNLMLKAISMLTIKPQVHEKFNFIFQHHQLDNQFDHYQYILKKLERQYSLMFTEERMVEFIYLLQMIHIRQQQKKWVLIYPDTVNFLEKKELFTVAKSIQKQLDETSRSEELAFLTIQLLGICQGKISPSRTDTLLTITEQIIDGFQRYTCIQLLDKNKAIETLFLHFKPAYYRMLFKIPITNSLLPDIKREHCDLFAVVKEVLKPIEEMLNIKIPEDEVGFLTLHFGGLLKKDNQPQSKIFRALIVCPNGVSSSLMLENQLKSLFPQFQWKSSLSSYEFQYLDEFEYDLVFSTVFLKTDKPLHIIKPIMSETEKQELVQTVKQTTLHHNFHYPTSDELIKVIRQYADIKQPELLKKALQNSLFQNSDTHTRRNQPVLKDLLTEDNILFEDKIDNWKDAIAKAAEPLLFNGSITRKYIDAMIENIESLGPYIIVGDEVAIPHARPEHGVNRLGMSILKLQESAYLLNNETNRVVIFICLAAIDNKTHLKALAQLTKLLSNPEKLKRLKEARTKQEILDLVAEYSI